MQEGDGAPPGQLAERLEDASVGSLVYVDERGQVRSPRRYRQLTVVRLAGLAAVLGAVNWLYWVIGGPVGLAVGGAMTVMLARHLPSWSRLRRAMALLVAERLEEAEALLSRVARGRGLPAAMKARAEHGLARVSALRGRHEEALARLESGLGLLARSRASLGQRRMLEYARVVALINLDRVAEARDRFDALPRTLEGDYLRAQRAAAELYLAFAEGEHRFDPAFLREQADIAEAIPSARVLLALLAWAQERAGHPRIAAQLLALARARPGERHLRPLYPRLAAWMDAQP